MRLGHLELGFSVAAQLAAEDFEALAAAGYKAVINNRPDGEKNDYLTAGEAAELAKAHGLEYRHIPVRPDQLSDEAVVQFKSALDELPGPVVAHCGTGRRSSAMWALCRAGTVEVDQILERCASAGHDLSPLRPRLVRLLRL